MTPPPFRCGNLVVVPTLTPGDIEAALAHTGVQARYDRDATRLSLREADILGRRCTVELEFAASRLRRVSIFAHLATDARDWSGWTFEQEMARKRAHDDLAAAIVGAPLTPLPIDVNGKAIAPLAPGPEYPNHARFDGGRVVSGYDSKGGMAQMWIDYD